MLLVSDLRPGTTFKESGKDDIYLVLDISANKSARAVMVIKIKVRNLRNGSITELSYTAGDKVEHVFLDKKEMTYLYDDDNFAVFMDTATYEQVNIDKKRLEWEFNFMVSNQNLNITFYEKEVIGVELPIKVTLEIIECDPAVKGDTVNKAMKDATLETGYITKVPMFVNIGDKIIVRTDTGEYQSRA